MKLADLRSAREKLNANPKATLTKDERDALDEVYMVMALENGRPPATLGALLAEYDPEGDPEASEYAEAWRAYQEQLSEYDRRRSLLGLVDLAEVMREGTAPPEMLVPDLLVARVHQTWYGPKESAKTWFALASSAYVMEHGGTVVWVDKEMGRELLAERLGDALRRSPEEVEQRFVYCEFPSMDGSRESLVVWRTLLRIRDPWLVVVDAQTEVLADMGLNENLGTDVERWSLAYLAPARRQQATTLMLDHTGHDEQGRPVASRQKGAAAKVELAFRVTKGFDRDTVGVVEIRRTKNTASAPIPEVQRWRVGGTPFVLDPGAMPEASESGDATWRIRADVLKRLRAHPGQRYSKTDMRGLVVGKGTVIDAQLVSLANEEGSRVRAEKGSSRGAASGVLYWFEPDVTETPTSSPGLVPSPPADGTTQGNVEGRRGDDEDDAELEHASVNETGSSRDMDDEDDVTVTSRRPVTSTVTTVTRMCDCGCGTSLEGRRTSARFASGACRQRARRRS